MPSRSYLTKPGLPIKKRLEARVTIPPLPVLVEVRFRSNGVYLLRTPVRGIAWSSALSVSIGPPAPTAQLRFRRTPVSVQATSRMVFASAREAPPPAVWRSASPPDAPDRARSSPQGGSAKATGGYRAPSSVRPRSSRPQSLVITSPVFPDAPAMHVVASSSCWRKRLRMRQSSREVLFSNI